ncbi:MAG TPA: hypothetical protein VID71_11380 [Steroidobacteraceae bacterium]|jgi:hypothetical protein
MMRLATVDAAALTRLLERYGLCMQVLADRVPIPGSYWGGSEAGLQGERLLARPDTPLHSILHESAHYICMDAQRRAQLARDAGGDDAEESAVCYLQVLMAEALPGVGRAALFADMDDWGYSFRLGSTAAWFAHDAEDAQAWLVRAGIIDGCGALTGRRRG